MGAIAVAAAGCSDDDLPIIQPSAEGTVTDNQGNTYGWVRIGNLDWTTSNARNGEDLIDAMYFSNFDYYNLLSDAEYEDYVDNYMPDFGNCMTYETAKESAPDGWRLPTDEDWQNLERTLGLDNPNATGFRGGNGIAYSMMEGDRGCGLNLTLGGGFIFSKSYGMMILELDWVHEYGFYWTSTPAESNSDQPTAYFRKVAYRYPGVARDVTRAENLMSVRWCRDAK